MTQNRFLAITVMAVCCAAAVFVSDGYAVVWPASGTKMVAHGYGDSETEPPYTSMDYHISIDIIPQGGPGAKLVAARTGNMEYSCCIGTFQEMWSLKTTGKTEYFDYAHVKKIGGGNANFAVTEGNEIDLTIIKISDLGGSWVEDAHVADHLDFSVVVIADAKETNPNALFGGLYPAQTLDVTIEEYRQQGENGFMTAETVQGFPLIWGKVDIIVMGADKMGYDSWIPGVHKISYKVINGPKPAAKIGEITLMDWSGKEPWGTDATYPVIYCRGEDPTDTKDHSNSTGPPNYHDKRQSSFNHHYYIVTNSDKDGTVEAADDDQHWYTKARGPAVPNPPGNGVGAAAARNNGEAFFPDGWYTVVSTVYAMPAPPSSSMSGATDAQLSKRQPDADAEDEDWVYINNFSQTIGQDSCILQPGDPVFVEGSNYIPSTNYTVYVIKDTDWPDGAAIPTHGAVVAQKEVTTDLLGNIQPTEVWNSYVANGDPDEGYDLIVDYDGDGIYQLPREGHTMDALGRLCACTPWGDVNCDCSINPVDVVYMVNYVYRSLDLRCELPNCPYSVGDVNCDFATNPVDVVYFVNYVYKNIKPFPCPPCE